MILNDEQLAKIVPYSQGITQDLPDTIANLKRQLAERNQAIAALGVTFIALDGTEHTWPCEEHKGARVYPQNPPSLVQSATDNGQFIVTAMPDPNGRTMCSAEAMMGQRFYTEAERDAYVQGKVAAKLRDLASALKKLCPELVPQIIAAANPEEEFIHFLQEGKRASAPDDIEAKLQSALDAGFEYHNGFPDGTHYHDGCTTCQTHKELSAWLANRRAAQHPSGEAPTRSGDGGERK